MGTTTPATASAGAAPDGLDESRVDAFAERLLGTYTAGMLNLMVDLGYRTGLFEALVPGSATSAELAERAGLVERYVREWLGSVVTGGLVDYDPSTGRYSLPAEHAVCLTGEGSLNLAPMSQITTLLAKHVDAAARVFNEGGGIPYEAFRPEFTDVMDGMSRGLFDGQLVQGIIPLTGLSARLTEGIQVADIGCGTGHSTNLMARAYPASTFVGYDVAEDALERARREAAAYRLDNVTFERLDLTQLAAEPKFDAIFAFDVIHDQVEPVTVLDRVRAALSENGVFAMMDIKASSNLEDNTDNPFAPLLYAISTLHCMTVSLAHDGAGLGTVWGEQRARRMLAEAGFTHVEVLDIPDDPLDALYLAT